MKRRQLIAGMAAGAGGLSAGCLSRLETPQTWLAHVLMRNTTAEQRTVDLHIDWMGDRIYEGREAISAESSFGIGQLPNRRGEWTVSGRVNETEWVEYSSADAAENTCALRGFIWDPDPTDLSWATIRGDCEDRIHELGDPRSAYSRVRYPEVRGAND